MIEFSDQRVVSGKICHVGTPSITPEANDNMKVVPVEGDPAPSPPLDNVDCVDTVIRSLRQEPATPKYNDVFFTVLFVGQLLAISVIAFWKGLPAVIKGLTTTRSSQTTTETWVQPWG